MNGIWLVGTAYAAAAARRAPAMDMETVAVGGSARRGLAQGATAGQELAGERVVASPRRNAEATPWFIQNREVAVLNIFTGFVGVAVATTYIVLGATRTGSRRWGWWEIRRGGFILLFAFTYLWVAFNQFLNAGGRAFGWYSLFVAITAIPQASTRCRRQTGIRPIWWVATGWRELIRGRVLGRADAEREPIARIREMGER